MSEITVNTSAPQTNTIEAYVLNEFDTLIKYYYGLLKEATLMSGPMDVSDPITQASGHVTAKDIAARIAGLEYGRDQLSRALRAAERKGKS